MLLTGELGPPAQLIPTFNKGYNKVYTGKTFLFSTTYYGYERSRKYEIDENVR
jgi:hypothetical protein